MALCSYLCWQHIYSRDHCTCIGRQRRCQQWHRNTIAIPLDRQTLRHRMCSDDLAKCEYPLPSPNSGQWKREKIMIFLEWLADSDKTWAVYILAIRRYFRNWMHSDVLRAMKRQHYRHVTVKCHCIHWCTWLVFRLRPFSPTENRANRTSHDRMHWKMRNLQF